MSRISLLSIGELDRGAFEADIYNQISAQTKRLLTNLTSRHLYTVLSLVGINGYEEVVLFYQHFRVH